MEQKHSEQFYKLVLEQLYILFEIWFTWFLFVRLFFENMPLQECKKNEKSAWKLIQTHGKYVISLLNKNMNR